LSAAKQGIILAKVGAEWITYQPVASITSGSGKIPIGRSSDGKLDSSWGGGVSSLATLDSGGKILVAQLPYGEFIGYQVLTSGTSYAPTTGTKMILVELQGAGGGGGGAATTGAGQLSFGAAGGGGSYVRKVFTGIGSGPYTYAVGAGGTGVSGGTGNTGGATTFTGPGPVTVTAGGGLGGTVSAAAAPPQATSGGAGGTGSNYDLHIPGPPGQDSVSISTAVLLLGEHSGNSLVSPDLLRPVVSGGGANGNAGGLYYGIGGGGGYNFASQAVARTGGTGGGGVIIVWEFA
jgi:hypothetical protein